jgi:hypothetical protein
VRKKVLNAQRRECVLVLGNLTLARLDPPLLESTFLAHGKLAKFGSCHTGKVLWDDITTWSPAIEEQSRTRNGVGGPRKRTRLTKY